MEHPRRAAERTILSLKVAVGDKALSVLGMLALSRIICEPLFYNHSRVLRMKAADSSPSDTT
jgi:hypothetical protein